MTFRCTRIVHDGSRAGITIDRKKKSEEHLQWYASVQLHPRGARVLTDVGRRNPTASQMAAVTLGD